MLFNSFDFGLFLVVVYLLYWSLGSSRRKQQNLLLLVASYVFYGLWDWRFLGLLVASSVVDYLVGLAITKRSNQNSKRWLLAISLIWNLGVLVLFKYFGFFLEGFSSLFNLDITAGYNFWNIAIPVGLSFYTFQTISYSVDVYRGKIKASNNPIEFFCFVAFFPQLVAGPIERAKDLLPQFKSSRRFDAQQMAIGLRQVLWGLFKKIIVAEKLGIAVTMAFGSPESYHGITLAFATILFCFQIYCDFSGYTDIALGTARLFGFRLSRNFNLPYLSKSITEFWRRWHITLSKWFVDYLYVPLARGLKGIGWTGRMIAIAVTMVLIGLWHGASWTFIAFGGFNAIVLIWEQIPFGKNKNLHIQLQRSTKFIGLMYFFGISLVSAVLFRADSIEQATSILVRIFSFDNQGALTTLIGYKLLYLVFLLVAEMSTRQWQFPLQKLELYMPKWIRWSLYYALIIIIIRYAEPKEAFIYFQF